MPRRSLLHCFLLFVLAHEFGSAKALAAPVDFSRDIQPIFQTRCAGCHGPEKQRSGLRLDRRASALQGGDSGVVIVPGKSADSLLLRKVTSQEKRLRMPPSGDPLTGEQIALLRAWIDEGAVWPEAAAAADPRKTHGAFQAVTRPTVPRVDALHWPRNPIDHFILARLEKAKLAPSPEADRATLIRRLSFDLLGLPPTPEEVEAFAGDPRADAYERLVERLLASPHYGERWARHWLDVVRFAESDGFETNQPRPNAWPYRDYLIRALNEGRPYDRLVQEQLAGDVLGEDAATGFLVGGAVDRVKSPDVVLTAQQRADELHDMVATTGSAFLGLTVGCARCHNHKFDPVSQLDYYGLKALLAGVQHGERRPRDPKQPLREQEAAELRQQLAAVAAELDGLEPLVQSDGPAGRRLPVNALRNVERFAPVRAKFVRFTVEATNSLEPCLDELEVFTSGPGTRNVALASAGAKAASSGNFPAGGEIHKLEHINDGRYGNGRSWISNQAGRGWVQVELKEPAVIDRIVWARDREGKYNDRLPTRYRIEVEAEPGLWQVVASSDDRVPFGGPAPSAPAALTDSERALYKRLTDQRTELRKRLDVAENGPLVYAGQFTKPELTHRLHRGDPMQKREPVVPAALSEFGAPLCLPPETPDPQRRLALAQWLTDPRHPLTARVLVNRLWQYHFGTGLVSTPSDFGLNGARPTHPDLLDWLATEFMAGGWSMKQVHRLIVQSSTYRQAGRANPSGLAVDADTRLLWRFPPRRLEAEPLRDAILAVSGNLDRRMGGPGFDLFEPNTNYVKVYNPKQEFGPAEWRRMVYQSKPRMQLDDTFGPFDCPDAGQIAPRRTSSTTPLQALNLLNSRFLVHQAVLFAERLRREAGDGVMVQVRRGFRLALQREPSEEELTASVRLAREHGLPALCRVLFNANEFLYVH